MAEDSFELDLYIYGKPEATYSVSIELPGLGVIEAGEVVLCAEDEVRFKNPPPGQGIRLCGHTALRHHPPARPLLVAGYWSLDRPPAQGLWAWGRDCSALGEAPTPSRPGAELSRRSPKHQAGRRRPGPQALQGP